MSDFKFGQLLTLSEGKRDDAAKAMQDVRAQLDRALRQLADLEQYRAEYQAKLATRQQSGFTMHEWREFQAFLVKLDQALAQQQTEIDRLQKLFDHSRDHWIQAERKVKAFDTLRVRHRKEEGARETRREQKTLDEFVSNRFKNRQ